MHDSLAPDQLYVTVDLLIMTVHNGKLNLLLSRRTAPPFEGRWALPGAFVGLEESAEEAARRLLREMLPAKRSLLREKVHPQGMTMDLSMMTPMATA